MHLSGHLPGAARNVAFFGVLVLLLGLLLVAPASAQVPDVTPARIEGTTRITTAVSVAAQRPAGAEVAVLARADDFPDALAAAALAGTVSGPGDAGLTEAPILLTLPDSLPDETAEALDNLGVEKVVLMGGLSAISAEVSAELEGTYEVERVAGTTRYETSLEVARRVVANAGLGTLGGNTTVFVASGEDFPDALAAGPLAYDASLPIVLTAQGSLPDATAAGLTELAPDQAIILGGTGAVSEDVEEAIEDLGIATGRIGGTTRTHTAAMVADFGIDVLGFDARHAVLARGDDFPDALAAGPHAGNLAAPLVITATSTNLGDATQAWFEGHCPTIEVVQAVGGQGAVATVTLEHAEQSAESCDVEPPTPDPTQSYLVAPQQAITAEPGTGQDFRVSTFSGEDLEGPFVLALFPCENVDALGSPKTFADGDGDGFADGIGNTTTNQGKIALLNGIDIPDTAYIADAEPAEDGTLRFTLFSFEEDCAVPVVFSDENENAALDVTAEGTAAEPFGLGQMSWETDPGTGPADQALLVSPQEAVTVGTEEPFSFRVTEWGADDLDNPADIALFPCENIDATASPKVFADVDDDGQADDIGTTNTGFARIALVNGVDVADTAYFEDADPGADGFFRFTMFSFEPDCTVPVSFQDLDDDQQLDLDGDDVPTEPFGVGMITWAD